MKFLYIFAACLALAIAAPTDCDTAESMRQSEESAKQVADQAALDAKVMADDEARMMEEKAAVETEEVEEKSMDEEMTEEIIEEMAEEMAEEMTEEKTDEIEDKSYMVDDAKVMAEDEARLVAEKAALDVENAKMIEEETARRLLDIDAIHVEDARVLALDAVIRADDEARRLADHTAEYLDLALWGGQDQRWRLTDSLHSAAAAGRLSAGVLSHGIVAGPAPVGFAHDALAYARSGFVAGQAPISAPIAAPFSTIAAPYSAIAPAALSAVSVAAAPAPIFATPAAFAPETVLRHSAVHPSIISHAIAQPDLAVRSLAPVTTVAGAGYWPHVSGARFLGQPC